MRPTPDQPGPTQESVWSYPRPAIAMPSPARIQIIHYGIILADSRNCIRTLAGPFKGRPGSSFW